MRIISVSYGHGTPSGNGGFSASGKLYDYGTDKNYRTGDVVVVPVEHAKSGKLYNTLAVVRLTSDENSAKGLSKLDRLTDPNKNIKPKDVGMRLEAARKQGLNVDADRQVNVTTLPGYNNRQGGEKWSQGNRRARLITRGGKK